MALATAGVVGIDDDAHIHFHHFINGLIPQNHES